MPVTKFVHGETPTADETLLASTTRPGTRQKIPCLVVIRGQHLGARLQLRDAELRIGRGEDCDFCINDRSVSRKHCSITRHGSDFWLRDLGSTNLTFLNNKVIDRVPLRDGDQIRIGACVLKFIDAGNIEADYHKKLHEDAIRDGLTGLYNRSRAIEALQAIFARNNGPASLAIIDIDHFKSINDRLGHLAGDSVLRQLTALFKEHATDSELFARLGGEEFALIMPDLGIEQARVRAESIRCAVERHSFDAEGEVLNMTISIGVTERSDDMNEPSDFLRRADEHLFRAKNSGRNRTC